MAASNQSKTNPDEILLCIILNYDREIVLPMKEGLATLEVILNGTLLEGYSAKKNIEPAHKQIKVRFMTRQELKEIELENKLVGDS